MNTILNKFERKEKKYVINHDIYTNLISKIKCYLTEDNFSNTTINSLYLDTDDYLLIRRSIEKPEYKEKLRVRCYENDSSSDKMFLEVKKKCEGMGYKKRIKLDQQSLDKIITEHDYSLGESHTAKELNWCLQRYQPKPKVYVGYKRQAFKGTTENDLRITFDNNLIYRTDDLNIDSGFYGDYIVDENLIIMEIKTTEGIPVWLSDILNNLHIYPSSFSKVGNAYKRELAKINNKEV